MPLEIYPLHTDDQILSAFDVMAELRPHLSRDAFVALVREQERQGFEMAAGLLRGTEVVAVVAGYRFTSTLARGPHLFVDDLVTAAAHQGKGLGRAMLAWLAAQAQRRNITKVWLDSRAAAVGFYEHLGFTLHTARPCFIDAGQLLTT